jgi:DNA polymerase I-like protein with 3'-5' exonuclease and polymerase domains
MAHAGLDEGLSTSVALANDSIYPYLVAGLYGFNIDLQKRMALIKDLEIRGRAYQKILDALVGSPMNSGSPKQCIDYFHGDMGYEVVKKSKTGSGPSVAGDALYLLLLAHPENPVPRVILAMRDVDKQLSQLQFKPLNFIHQS